VTPGKEPAVRVDVGEVLLLGLAPAEQDVWNLLLEPLEEPSRPLSLADDEERLTGPRRDLGDEPPPGGAP